MYSYVIEELPEVIAAHFPADMSRQGIFGHSMGGHGALTIALKHPDLFRSCSAFAPIVQPSTSGWSKPALQKYLGPDEAAWRAYDTTALIADGHRFKEFLVDQGTADPFLQDGLKPWLLQEACEKARIPLTLNMREGYDHSYYFISTFMSRPYRLARRAAFFARQLASAFSNSRLRCRPKKGAWPYFCLSPGTEGFVQRQE